MHIRVCARICAYTCHTSPSTPVTKDHESFSAIAIFLNECCRLLQLFMKKALKRVNRFWSPRSPPSTSIGAKLAAAILLANTGASL